MAAGVYQPRTVNKMSTPAPAWYPDPSNPSQMRYWDGTQWTDNTQSAVAPQPGFAPPAPQRGYGQASHQQGYGQTAKPDSYLAWAILTTVLCCLPFGIVSIINASKVDSLWAQGLHQEAAERSAAAKKWAIISAVSVLAVSILYIGAMVVFGASVATTP